MGAAEDQQQQWPQQDQFPPVSTAPSDDFSNLLDFGIDLDFPLGDESGYELGVNQQSTSQPHWTRSSYQYGDRSHRDILPGESLARDHSTPRSAFLSPIDSANSVEYRNDDSNGPQWMPNQPFQQHYSVPPTPNSSEMYPASYLQQMMAHPSHRVHQYRKDEGTIIQTAAFTPHESPQFVGSESSISFADFSDPNTFKLDPLTSPALNPQPSSALGSVHMHPHTADSSVTGSPIDLSFDASGNMSPSFHDRPRKTRKRARQATSAPNSAGPRPVNFTSSRKRQGSVTTRNQAKIAAENPTRHPQLDKGLRKDSTRPASDAMDSTSTSASPQPLSESVMAPPPKPNSVRSTPTLVPLVKSQSDGRPPATPASLMRLPNAARSGSTGAASPGTSADSQLQNSMEELTLPEAATSHPTARPSASKQTSSALSTPIINSNASSSAISNAGSPTKASTPGSKGPLPRGSRKRNSTSTHLISPALRPRISPSIKPLLPDGAQHHISDETHALLLASKSNYQNLLEGNHLPGVNYPSELSTNLTSKRTSHKIAEQGRRNRINTALQEMQTLLPAAFSPTAANGSSPRASGGAAEASGSPTEADGTNSKVPNTPGQTGNSKAATVEQAIEYIKILNAKIADKESENEKLKQEMATLKAKMNVGAGG